MCERPVASTGTSGPSLHETGAKDVAKEVADTSKHRDSRDATSELDTLEALERTVFDLRSAQRMARLASWQWDPATDRVVWSKELYEMFGLDPEGPPPDFAEQTALYGADSLRELSAAVEVATNTGASYDLEIEFFRADSTRGWMRSWGEAVHDDDGNVVEVRGYAQEITEHVEARRLLERSEHALRATQRMAGLGSWEWEIATDRVVWSDELFELFGFDPAHSPPGFADHARLFGAETWERLADAVDETMRMGVPYLMEGDIVRADGGRRSVQIRGEAVRDEGDSLVGLRGFVLDITELKLLQSEVSRTARLEMIGRLAGGIAHDFNNVLSVILGRAELAMSAVHPDSEVMNDLAEISAAAERSAQLTTQLLTFARQQAVEPVVLDLNQQIAGALSLLERLIGDTVTITWEPASDLWSVCSDPSQVDQVVNNLGMNARDAIGSRPGGRIAISTSNVVIDRSYVKQHPDARPGEFVRITVRDNGAGIDTRQLDQIFEPFFTTKGFAVNHGLGLATVMGAIRQNEGFIIVASGEGQGSRFEVHLPRHSGAPEVRPTDEPSSREPSRATVLVVDDNPDVLATVAETLARTGYTVLRATDATAALRIVESPPGHIELLITDVSMPNMNGFELAAEVAEHDRTIRSLFISGYHAEDTAPLDTLDRARYLQKPFTHDDLLAAVHAALMETN